MKRDITLIGLVCLLTVLAFSQAADRKGVDGQNIKPKSVTAETITAGTTLLVTNAISTPNSTLNNCMVIFGDSVGLNGAQTETSDVVHLLTSPTDLSGWWWKTNDALGQPFATTYNAGVGGDTTTLMLARIQTDVIARKCQFVTVMGAGNDIANGVPVSTITANLKIIYDTIRAAGSRLVVSSVFPSTSYNNAYKIRNYGVVDAFIKAYAANRLDVIFADMGSANRTSMANPTPTENTTSDGVHPNNYGGGLYAQKLYSALAGATGLPSPATLITANTGQGNLLANGLMTGTAGGKFQAASGNVADSWTVSGTDDGYPTTTATAVASKVARTDGLPGEWQQIAHTGMTPPQNSTARTNLYQTISTGFTAGQTISGYVEWQADDDWTSMKKFYVKIQFGATPSDPAVYSMYHMSSDDAAYDNKVNMISGVMRIPPTVIPAGTTQMKIFISFHGDSGTYRIGRVQLNVQ